MSEVGENTEKFNKTVVAEPEKILIHLVHRWKTFTGRWE